MNKSGDEIIEGIKKSGNQEAVIKDLNNKYDQNNGEIGKKVTNLIDQLIKLGFLHNGTYQRKKTRKFIPDTSKIYLESLYLNPTNRCNLNCVYCFNSVDRKRQGIKKEMGPNDYFTIIDNALELNVKKIVFTGGEPLLYQYLFDIAKYAKKKGFYIELLTNGTLINSKIAVMIANTFDAVSISLDSKEKDEHEQLRGKGSFDAVIKGIKLLKKCGLVHLHLSSVCTAKNMHSMVELQKFAYESLGIHTMKTQLYIPYNVSQIDKVKDMIPKYKDIVAMDKLLKNYLKSIHDGTLLNSGPIKGKRYICGVVLGELSIAPNGNVYPCHTLHKEEFLCGNVLKNGLKDIYSDSEIVKKFQSLTVDKIDKCRNCVVKHVCAGGCRSMALNMQGNITSSNDFYCDYLKQNAINKLWSSCDTAIAKAIAN